MFVHEKKEHCDWNETIAEKRFHKNCTFLLALTKEKAHYVCDLRYDINHKRKDKLFLSEIPVSERNIESTLELIGQVYKRAIQQLSESSNDYFQKIKKFDQLKRVMVNYFPQVMDNKFNETTAEFFSGIECKNKLEQALSQGNFDIHVVKRKGPSPKLNDLPIEVLIDKVSNIGLAVAKDVCDSLMVKESVNKLRMQENKLKFLAGFHEILMSRLDLLLGGRLLVPLTLLEKKRTFHAFVDNCGTLATFNKNCLEKILSSLQTLPTLSSQRCVLSQILSHNQDCHQNNILLNHNSEPIPIDFGIILVEKGLMRASYLSFPALDLPIDAEEALFYKKLDIEDLIEKLTKVLQLEYSQEWKDHEQVLLITRELQTLKARLYMVQIAIGLGYNLRQILAMDFVPFSHPIRQECAVFHLKNSHLSLQEQRTLFRNSKLITTLKMYLYSSGFSHAYQSSSQPFSANLVTCDEWAIEGGLNIKRFKEKVEEELVRINQESKGCLYEMYERYIYGLFRMDATVYPKEFEYNKIEDQLIDY